MEGEGKTLQRPYSFFATAFQRSKMFSCKIWNYILINLMVMDLLHTGHTQGPPKKCIHTLTKENSMLYVSTKFNCTSQVEYKLQ